MKPAPPLLCFRVSRYSFRRECVLEISLLPLSLSLSLSLDTFCLEKQQQRLTCNQHAFGRVSVAAVGAHLLLLRFDVEVAKF